MRQTSYGEAHAVVARGPKVDTVPTELINEVASAGTVAASGSWTSNALTADGFYDAVIGVTLSQTGSVVLLRYIDDAATVALDSGQSQALTAATAAVLVVTDGKPFASYKLKISNTGGSTATISGFAALFSTH